MSLSSMDAATLLPSDGVQVDPAWYWAGGPYDDISNGDMALWAATPLGAEPICLMGEWAHNYYAAWTEGALRSSRQCLSTRYPPSTPIGDQLQRIYTTRDSISPGSGWLDSQNFNNIAPVTGVKTWSNEYWWPYDYKKADAEQKYCQWSNIGFKDYPFQPATS